MVGLSWNLLLALIWMALTGSFTGPNLVLGALFGYAVLALIQNQIPVLNGYGRKVPQFVIFALIFFWDVILANLRIAYEVATPNLSIKPGVFAYPLAAKTTFEITSLANYITLTPGTLSLDISDDRSVLYIHSMYIEDEDALIEEIRRVERRILRLLR